VPCSRHSAASLDRAPFIPSQPRSLRFVGTVLWIALATYKSLPVSTTHAIVGSITGVAIFNGGLRQVNWAVLGGKIAIPMLMSPILAFGFTVCLLKLWRAVAPVVEADCICVEGQSEFDVFPSGAAMLHPVAAWLRFTSCNVANRSWLCCINFSGPKLLGGAVD